LHGIYNWGKIPKKKEGPHKKWILGTGAVKNQQLKSKNLWGRYEDGTGNRGLQGEKTARTMKRSM